MLSYYKTQDFLVFPSGNLKAESIGSIEKGNAPLRHFLT